MEYVVTLNVQSEGQLYNSIMNHKNWTIFENIYLSMT